MPNGVQKALAISMGLTAISALVIVILGVLPAWDTMSADTRQVLCLLPVICAAPLALSCIIGGLIMLRRSDRGQSVKKDVALFCVGIFILGTIIWGAFVIRVIPDESVKTGCVQLDKYLFTTIRGENVYVIKAYDHDGNPFYDSNGNEVWLVCNNGNLVKDQDGYILYSDFQNNEALKQSLIDALVGPADAWSVEEDLNE